MTDIYGKIYFLPSPQSVLRLFTGVQLPLAWRGMLAANWAEVETEYALEAAPALKGVLSQDLPETK